MPPRCKRQPGILYTRLVLNRVYEYFYIEADKNGQCLINLICKQQLLWLRPQIQSSYFKGGGSAVHRCASVKPSAHPLFANGINLPTLSPPGAEVKSGCSAHSIAAASPCTLWRLKLVLRTFLRYNNLKAPPNSVVLESCTPAIAYTL